MVLVCKSEFITILTLQSWIVQWTEKFLIKLTNNQFIEKTSYNVV